MTEAQLPPTLRRLGGHASSVQLQQALNASQATVSRWLAPLVAGGRVFLQSQRFDRTAQGGRVGMVSLEAYDARYVGLGHPWSALAALTHRAGSERLNASDVQTLCLLDAYGALIANNDRHHGFAVAA